jgi:hypothetical protein
MLSGSRQPRVSQPPRAMSAPLNPEEADPYRPFRFNQMKPVLPQVTVFFASDQVRANLARKLLTKAMFWRRRLVS